MAMSVGGKGGGGGRRGSRRGSGRGGPISDINVTPLVDVMLVLLIIFMVAAPMMTSGVPIDLPQTQAGALNAQTQPITISIKADGQVFLQETQIQAADIAAKLQAIATTGYNERIFVRGDGKAPYGVIADVMSRIQEAGYKNIGLVTQQITDH
ncbi:MULTISPECIES: protein TolR [Rhizobium]|uniref:Biopolymer transport protein TolR n=1 Tax=Rhizobium lusitanum TaxID=293958 RepID=A0A1C3UTD4_9HYPH|nr:MULTISPECIES: protein TolR [Rhizobium]NRP86646.1 Biopolymer transport protein ExbD [Ensifer adhaerens]NKJ03426.1 biopolymer transport protein TolR [Rhizobium sp. SG741]NKJ33617.1 biopolymer transport protein TolR [Rhizobium sp. SG570]NTJ08145.1 protein TolR [Rhizobium lusitanum]SCB18763.1 biopolymer transport protein TolR [Rhizobium lusitanum]